MSAKTKATTIDDVHGLHSESGWTDAANADRFAAQNKDKLRFVPEWKRWLVWDGRRWHDDSGVAARQRAKRYAKSLWTEYGRLSPELDRNDAGKLHSFIKATNSESKINAFLKLAETDVRLVAPVEVWNQKPLLLNVLNGTIDLATGKLRPHNPADHLTQLAPVMFDPEAKCEQWESTLSLIFDGDDSLVAFVQELLGYCISGEIGEAILPIAVGNGANGKSTIWNTIIEILGDYAVLALETLLIGKGNNHPTEMAALYQRRFVPISEPEKGGSLRVARLKALTGETTITARGMNENPWSFRRTHKFWMSTNHLPRIDDTDDGIWRRVKVIPFRVDLRKRVAVIPDFQARLVREEGPGILNWLLAGWLRYQERGGFKEPDSVKLATRGYRDDSDPLGEFIADNCVVEDGAIATAKDIFAKYQEAGGKENQTSFGKELGSRYRKEKPDSGKYRKQTIYHGIRLRTDKDDLPKSPEKGELPLVAPSQNIGGQAETLSRGATIPPVATGGRNCPMCDGELTITPRSDFINFNCEACGFAEAERVPA